MPARWRELPADRIETLRNVKKAAAVWDRARRSADEEKKEFLRIVRWAHEEDGWSIAELARILGMDRRRLWDLLTYAVLTFWVLIVLFPLYWIGTMSLKHEVDIFAQPPRLFDFEPALDNYLTVLNLGAEGRMNLPGSTDAHWRWRCSEEMLHSSAFRRLRDVTASSRRLHVLQSQQPASAIGVAS